MLSPNIREIQKTARLQALYEAKKDKQGDTKTIKVYERLDFEITQKNRVIKKHYYNLIYSKQYTFTNSYDEIELYRNVRLNIERQTPFTLDIQLLNKNENNGLIDYYNKQSKKYFDMLSAEHEYTRKKQRLMELKNNINNIYDTIDFVMELSFKL